MIALAATLVLFAGGAAETPRALYVEERIEAGPSAGALETKGVRRTWVLPDRVRVEEGKRVEIYDARRGLFHMFDTEARLYTQARRETLAQDGAVPRTAIVGLSLDGEGEPRVAGSAFERTGATATIGRWDAVAWRATEEDPEGGRGTLWIARDAGASWAELQRVACALFPGPGDTMARYLRQVEALGGWPVRTERRAPGLLVRYTVTKIERVSEAPSSLFEEIPADLRRIEMR